MYALQALSMLLPLLSFPYLTRTLGPDSWGALALATAFTTYVQTIVTYGFDVSGVRDAGQAATDTRERGEVLSTVVGGQLLLALAVAPAALLAPQLLPVFRHYPSLPWLALASGVVQGLSLKWYLQGIGRLPFAVTSLLVGQAAYVGLLFVTVHGRADVSKVVALNVATAAVSLGLMGLATRRTFERVRPTLRATLARLRAGRHYFYVVIAITLTGALSPVLVGMISTTTEVAYFASANRIVTFAWQAAMPILSLALPKIAELHRHRPDTAARSAAAVTIGVILWGVVAAIALTVLRVPALRLLAGGDFVGGTPSLVWLAWSLPFIALGTCLNLFWLLPRHAERHLLPAFVVAGAINILVALLLVPRFGARGMAIGVFSAEAVKELFLVAATIRVTRRPVPAT